MKSPGAGSPLLAKSPRGKSIVTLIQHLRDTDQAASELFRSGTRWSRSYLRFFRMAAADHEVFLLNLRIAALFHDIGKANEDFQAAMGTHGFKAQSLRHEHLSALLLCEPTIRSWLGMSPNIDVDVVTAAVLSHHLKAGPDGDWHVLNPKHATPTRLLFDDQQVRDALDRIANVAGISAFVGNLPALRYVDMAWSSVHGDLFSNASRFGSQIRKSPERLKLTLAVKAALIVSDSVSSGIVREGLSIQGWIDEVAHSRHLDPDEIERSILEPRVRQISATKPFAWHSFQTGAATVGRRGLLLAACGAGKTLAAWKWAAAVSRAEPIARVIFLYPTRGTATEGFRDYVAHAPEGDAALVYGTSGYELAEMMLNPPESLQGKQVGDEASARLYALGLWNKRYFSATVDQFLGFMEHSYGGMCLLPAFADAAVVFDEIHSYDAKMWNALVTFLDRFDVPVLGMTATLPPSRKAALERHLKTYPTEADLADLRDLTEMEAHPRYRLVPATREGAIESAAATIESGQRVLWVVNTVRRCQQIARLMKARLSSNADVVVYHSRFRLKDRQSRHRQTVDAFRAPKDGDCPPVLAVTTQVCEMSLDLDADLLISEHAPVSSLVQRFGRANRHLRRGKDFRATLMTYSPESNLPYERQDLEAAEMFLNSLLGESVSQRDLALGLEKHSVLERLPRGSTAFIEGGYFATPGALRDSDDLGCACVLDSDVAEFRRLSDAKQPTDGLIITIPKKYVRPSDGTGLPTWIHLAEGDRYDPWLGFLAEDDPDPSSVGGGK